MLRIGTSGRYLCLRIKKDSAMFEFIITLALAALAIWLLVDSAVEFTQDTRDDIPATEP